MGPKSARSRQGSRLTLILAIALLPAAAREAHAAFSQTYCSPTTWGWFIQTEVGSTRFDRDSLDANLYINNSDRQWLLYMNPNVKQVQLRTNDGFNIETGYDYLMVQSASPLFKYTGIISAGDTRAFNVSGSTSSEKGLVLNWLADYSNIGTPAKLDSAKFICQSTPQPVSNSIAFTGALNFYPRYSEGLLLGDGDTIYYSVAQAANVPVTIALNKIAGVTDMDLYVSATTATPDDSNFTWRGYTGQPNEYLRIPAISTARTLYIGVHSFTNEGGGGHFNLHIFNQGTTTPMRPKVCTPGFALDPSSPRTTQLINQLKNTALRITAATRGNWVFGGFDIYQSPTCAGHQWCSDCDGSCKICLMSLPEEDSCTIGQTVIGGTVRVANINCSTYDPGTDVRWGAWTWAHEFGHGFLNLDDEYYWGVGSFCGHTLMSGPSNSNFLCTPGSHCKDSQVGPMNGESRCNSGGDNWTHMSSLWARPGLTSEPDIELFNNWNQSAMDAVTVVLH